MEGDTRWMTVQLRYYDMNNVERVRTLVKARASARFHVGMFDFFLNSAGRPAVYMRSGTDATVNYVLHSDAGDVNGMLTVRVGADHCTECNADGVKARLVGEPGEREGEWQAHRLELDVRENATHRAMRAAGPLQPPQRSTERRHPYSRDARPYDRPRSVDPQPAVRREERRDDLRRRWRHALEDDTRAFLDFVGRCRDRDDEYLLHHARDFVRRMGFACDNLDMCLSSQ